MPPSLNRSCVRSSPPWQGGTGGSAQRRLNSAGQNINLGLCFSYMDQRCEDAWALYQRCISNSVVEYLQKQVQVKVRHSIYTAQVVIWLMILQRLQPRGTLTTSVAALLAGGGAGLIGGRP